MKGATPLFSFFESTFSPTLLKKDISSVYKKRKHGLFIGVSYFLVLEIIFLIFLIPPFVLAVKSASFIKVSFSLLGFLASIYLAISGARGYALGIAFGDTKKHEEGGRGVWIFGSAVIGIGLIMALILHGIFGQ